MSCTRSAILAERAGAEIERTYQRNSLTQAEHVRKVLNDVFDQLPELLVDLDDLDNKCASAERRILNRALFTRITVDDEENATYRTDETTASVLAHASIDAPAKVTAETKLPRHQAGQVSILKSSVDLGGFEPPTFSLRTRRATNCAIGP